MSEWQPIKTAPKDGTTVLVATPLHDGCWNIEVGYFTGKGWWVAVKDYEKHYPGHETEENFIGAVEWRAFATSPSHWMPLPEPPGKSVCPGACHWWKPFKDDVVKDCSLIDIEVCERCGKHREICGSDELADEFADEGDGTHPNQMDHGYET